MVLTVSPIRTVMDGTTLEYYGITVTSRIDQTIEVYRDANLLTSGPVTANTPTKFEWGVQPAGYHEIKVIGVTAGEWRGRIAMTGTQYTIEFVDEEGTTIDGLNIAYMNLDETFLINPKRTVQTWGHKYTLSGRWILEVGKKEASSFRYGIIDLATITGDTTITLPLLKSAMIAVKMDLGVVWPAIIGVAQAIDWVFGMVASALGFKDYPSLATYIVNYMGNTIPIPPYSWELKDNHLTIYYKVTTDFFGVIGAVALFVIIIIALALPLILEKIGIVATEWGETARSENQREIAGEMTKANEAWLKYADEHGLTAQETLRGKEALTGSYSQMSQNVEPKPFPWETVIGVLGGIGVLALVIWLLTRRPVG